MRTKTSILMLLIRLKEKLGNKVTLPPKKITTCAIEEQTITATTIVGGTILLMGKTM